MQIASLKLRFFAGHVRIVPATDALGCPFAGPGVDLFGEEASESFALAAPLVGWLDAREPISPLRTLSLDLRKHRLLVTVDVPGDRPRVVAIDERSAPAAIQELESLAAPLVTRLGELAAARIAARGAHAN